MSKLCTECYKQEYGSLPTSISLSQEPGICEKCGKEDQLILNKETSETLTVAECQVETQKHIEAVRKYIRFMIDKIDMRGVKHDASKLESPEVEVFAEYTPKLNTTTFGSDDYYANLEEGCDCDCDCDCDCEDDDCECDHHHCNCHNH